MIVSLKESNVYNILLALKFLIFDKKHYTNVLNCLILYVTNCRHVVRPGIVISKLAFIGLLLFKILPSHKKDYD